MSAFEELGVMPELIEALDDMSWHLPTPVQTESVPLILGGGDVAVAAETGSGKTGAFCLPVAQVVYETRNTNLSKSTLSETAPTAEEQAGPIKLSEVDRGKHVAVADGFLAQCRDRAFWQGVRATRGVASGKWYFIGRPRDDGICRMGWSSVHAQLNLGTDQKGFGYGGTGMRSHGGSFDAYGKPYTTGDQVCCMVEFQLCEDIERSRVLISFALNEKELGEAFDVSWKELGLDNMSLIPTLAMKNAELEILLQERSTTAEKHGFKHISGATLADAVISEEAQALFDEYAEEDQDGDQEMREVESEKAGEKGKAPLALILEPSRELAGQVENELTKIGKQLPDRAVRHLLLIGGGSQKTELAMLKRGVDIVTGTLGSIVKHVKKRTLSLDSIRFFVMDEADTFATDNLRDILFLHEKVPTKNRVQTLLFSATLHSPEIRALSDKIQSFPTWVDLKGKEAVPETLHHTMVRIDADADTAMLDECPDGLEWPLDEVHIFEDKGRAKNKKARAESNAGIADGVDAADLRSQTIKKLKLIALKKVIDANAMSQAMIFVRTQRDADNVESFLIQCSGVSASDVASRRFRGRHDSGPEVEYSCSVLHGGRRQEERNQALAAFKASEVRFLVCTDVAARGIDIVGLPFLVNVTLPDKSENYIHRVGRVGRAERLGLAVSLVAAQKEAVWFHTCKKTKGKGVCNNRKLVTARGCVMWYNEGKLLGEIEERLKGRIEELGPDLRRKNVDAGPVMYGSKIGEMDVSSETAKRVERLQPAVRKLVRMEEEAQAMFFALQGR